jgi:hypothetical protein
MSGKKFALCLLGAIVCAAVAMAQVDDKNGVFQLEGNATNDTSVCFPLGSSSCTTITFGANTDDWANIFSGTNHALAKSFVTDKTNTTADDIFTGGGSKDIYGISKWAWKAGKPQGKDDIAHAFAAAYKLSNGHIAIYFGMDRYDNSGDATAGFWFLQDSTVGIAATCSAGGGCPFTGKHTDGDLLIVSDFSTGGAVSEILVFKWVGDDATGQLVQQQDLTSNATCNPVTGSSNLCAIVNPIDGLTSPWTFVNKSGETTFGHGELLEGAIDLNAIYGNNLPCFTTFMAETRSSTSPTATLSDLTPPTSFPLCSLSVTKSCTGSSILNGNQIQYNFSGSVTNTGIGTLYNATVSDTPPSASLVANSLVLNQPTTGAFSPGSPVTYSGSFKTTAQLGTNDKNSISATASSFSTGTPQNVGPATANWGDPTQGSCPPAITAALTLSKKCESCLQAQSGGAGLLVKTSEAVKVCNTGNVNITNITVRDCRGTLGTDSNGNPTCSTGFVDPTGWSSLSLNAAVNGVPTCTVLTTTTTPSSTAACTNGNCSFSDVVIASGTAALGGGTVTAVPSQASCPLCPIATSCPTITFP